MKKTADVLYLLSSFSARSGFVEKAAAYADAGHQLFPRDSRHLEVKAYMLVLQQQYAEADQLLEDSDLSSKNLEYLRARVAMLRSKPTDQIQHILRKYLAY